VWVGVGVALTVNILTLNKSEKKRKKRSFYPGYMSVCVGVAVTYTYIS
jgi:hypothetical protein